MKKRVFFLEKIKENNAYWFLGARDHSSPYKRKKTSDFCKDQSEELGHGRWTELETMVLIVIFKMARRMLVSDDDMDTEVWEMYNSFVTFNATLSENLDVREKSVNQIKFKLLHLTK